MQHDWGEWATDRKQSNSRTRRCDRCQLKDVVAPKAIVRVPKTDLSFAAIAAGQMKLAAPKERDDDALESRAVAVAMQYQRSKGGIEHGHEPASPDPEFTYLSWEWDFSRVEYVVVSWDGRQWRA